MAIGKASDFVIFSEQFFGGMFETLTQFSDAFNGASRGALRLAPRDHIGDFTEESFIPSIPTLITRRDTTSVAAATDLAVTQASLVGIKLNRKIGPVAQTLDAWRKIGRTGEELSLRVGQQTGKAIAVEYINQAVRVAGTVLSTEATLIHTVAATMAHSDLLSGLSKLGDASGEVVAWVMHSKPFFDLLQQSITDNIFQIGGMVIIEGNVATFNRPVIVTDSTALVVTGAPDTYRTLGLVVNAVSVEESEEQEIASDLITGLENLVGRIQGEFAYTVGAKGFAFAKATVNPTDAAIATGGNWTNVASDLKLLPGIMVVTQ